MDVSSTNVFFFSSSDVSSCYFRDKGAINLIFFSFVFALKDAINWMDSSVLVFSPLLVVFTLIAKHCLCPSVIHVNIPTLELGLGSNYSVALF